MIKHAVPILPSIDIQETIRFFATLGFTHRSYGDYALFYRDLMEVHYWLTDDEELPKVSACYARVTEIDELYEEMKSNGVVHPNGHLENKPWGMREFAILDVHGNLIRFGQDISDA